jgi:hypothetical protein
MSRITFVVFVCGCISIGSNAAENKIAATMQRCLGPEFLKNIETFDQDATIKRKAYLSPLGSHLALYQRLDDPCPGLGQVIHCGYGVKGMPLRLSLYDLQDSRWLFHPADSSSQLLRRDYYPGGFVDTWASQGIEWSSMAVFIQSDVMALRATVRASKTSHKLQWVVHGGMAIPQHGKMPIPQSLRIEPGVIAFRDALSFIDLVLPENFSTIKALPNFNSQDPGCVPQKNFDKLPGIEMASPGFLTSSEPFKLAPNRPVTVLFLLRLSEQKPTLSSQELFRLFQQHPEAVASDAMQYWQRLPTKFPSAISSSHPYYKLAWRAFLTLENIRWTPPYDTLRMACTCPAKEAYTGHWLWDGAFHSLGYSEWDARTSRDQILVLTRAQEPLTGIIPNYIPLGRNETAGLPMDRSQPPVLAWTAWVSHRRNPDTEFLNQVYPSLCRFATWWTTYRDMNQDGLCEYRHSPAAGQAYTEKFAKFESGWDTSVRWDSGCSNKDAVDLNCFLVVQYRCLAHMAQEIGLDSDVKLWQEKAETLAALINEKLWDEKAGLYFDYDIDRGALSRVKSPAGLFPLWAHIAPKERGDAMIRNLTDTNLFWPSLPAVAYNHPEYRAEEYWRGPTWINLYYLVLSGVQQYGYAQVAKEMKDHILAVLAANPHIGEYYDSRTGESIGAQQYGWTSAFILEMLLDRDSECAWIY